MNDEEKNDPMKREFEKFSGQKVLVHWRSGRIAAGVIVRGSQDPGWQFFEEFTSLGDSSTPAGEAIEPSEVSSIRLAPITVHCGKCGHLLLEDPAAPAEARTPCPNCGSVIRRFAVTASDNLPPFHDAAEGRTK
jgi:hypothetical protein